MLLKNYKGKQFLRGSFCCAMPSLTDAEKVALQRAVSVHGRDWSTIRGDLAAVAQSRSYIHPALG